MAGAVLWIVRLVATLLFFGSGVMAMATIQSGEEAWGYGLGTLAFGIAAGYLWADELAAQSNLREEQKAAELRRRQQDQLGAPIPPPNSGQPFEGWGK